MVGPSSSMLRKASRFAALYPSDADPQALIAIGAGWTRLELTFSVGDKKQRHELLRQALNEAWSSENLRFEVQRRFP